MTLDAKAVRQGGIFAVDLGTVRLLRPSLSKGLGIRSPVANPRFLLEPSMLYDVAVVTVATVTVVTVDVINVV